jgi:hypothetical protein
VFFFAFIFWGFFVGGWGGAGRWPSAWGCLYL